MIGKTKQLKFWASIKFSRTSTHTLGRKGDVGRQEKPLKTLDNLSEYSYIYDGLLHQKFAQKVSKRRSEKRQNLVVEKLVALLLHLTINLKRLSGFIRDLIQKIFENQNHKYMLNITTIAPLIVTLVDAHTELRSH